MKKIMLLILFAVFSVSAHAGVLEDCIKNPLEHIKDRNRARTFYYYHNRKHDKNHLIKVVVKVTKHDPRIGYISTIFITSKIRNKE